MAYGSKTSSMSRRSYKTRRFRRRSRRGFRNVRIQRNRNWNAMIYNYKQKVAATQLTFSSSAATHTAYQFTLNELPQASTFAALYDQYKISKAKIEFYPINDWVVINADATATEQSAGAMPYCYGVIDYDDANVLTSYNQYFEYQNCKYQKCTKKMKFIIRPHMALAAYSGMFSSYANQASQWLDVASGDVQHYGIKFGYDAAPANFNGRPAFNVIITMYISFKNVR